MTKQEALELLKSAPTDEQPSRVNPYLTRQQCVDIVRGAIEGAKDGPITSMSEKRVWQVVKDQKRPRY